MYGKQLLALAGIAGLSGLLISAPAAHAVTVDIGLSADGISYSDQSASSIAGVSFNGWNVTASGIGNPPLTGVTLLSGNTLNVSSSSKSILYVAITVSGVTAPLGAAQGFESSFTSNLLSGGITSVIASTFISSANANFTGTLLSTVTFTGLGTQVADAVGNTGAGPYSLTEIFKISSDTAGNSNDTTVISSTPLPAAFPLFAGGLGVVGLLARRKKRKNATAL